ncbi:probable LRR receptor-like serine/threonine-protein kinase At1g07650 [Zingiber officinale]|uniref:probable LRR receptor-like serine/threonine-protein kinase At1g07650 n=1 Tax=Zingiber officinale TaxID=94328 RepID=UPI001C4B11AB|nr:probable LRR receptor-like serine/threonine-protein kinase At1g07650 [Zingiber officinale]
MKMSTTAICFELLLLASCLLFSSVFPVAFGAKTPRIHPNEKNLLKRISTKLNIDWNFELDPCSRIGNWSFQGDKSVERKVDCDCSFNSNSVCHIVNISLKAQNLSGAIPKEFGSLRYLQQLDLSRNVLNGTVPDEWKNMRLQGLSLMGNRLSGPFPLVLTKITSLTNVSIEGNLFHGPLPPDLGNLVHMEKFVISSNNFTGEIPRELAEMTNLTDLRISNTNLTGRLPNFVKLLKKLEKLHIQGCRLEGPIPSGISYLTSLNDLRISDLRGNISSAFPDLGDMETLKTLILRNCSIRGNIPPYIGDMEKLKNLDLSFNQLSGEIPSSFSKLQKVDFIYLTGNLLTGNIPGWILSRNKNADASFNNFTFGGSGPMQCPQGSVNLAESYSHSADNVNTVQPCLKRNFPCSSSSNQYSLHINCGGKEVTVNGIKYEADTEERGASELYLSTNWAFSSTGNFMDNDIDADNYIAKNLSELSMPNSQLYTRARLSPLSLTYYGLCLMKGSYTVKLHFAEIVFTDDNTFQSLGKRVFNVFIQDNLVSEDFNIEDAARGSGKPIIKSFNASVSDNTLKIKFYWSGKGTTGIPSRGIYGPLISAISVTPNFQPPPAIKSSIKKKLHSIIIAVVIALVFLIVLFILGIWRKKRQNILYKELGALDLQTGCFTLRQIKAATKNFDSANKIGEGGFGSVYKGLLSDGTIIAVKQLSSRSKQGNREFINEIGMVSALQHPNLVKLYGCCMEGNQLLLIYEYMENNCLSRALFGKGVKHKIKLDWSTRCKICIGIARGLVYLHEESRIRIVHRDIKASNVLLDGDLNAKISDFGLAKLYEEDHTHISTRIAGTIGYMAPEYAMRGYLTDKADVYSFGIVALELVSGKSNTSYRPKDEFVNLLDWACVLHDRGNLMELVDPDLGSAYPKDEVILMLNVALLCTNSSPTLRPTMSKVVSLLEGQTPIQPFLLKVSASANSLRSGGFTRTFRQNSGESQSLMVHASSIDAASNHFDPEDDVSFQLLAGSIHNTERDLLQF